jgi:hypothetical protein
LAFALVSLAIAALVRLLRLRSIAAVGTITGQAYEYDPPAIVGATIYAGPCTGTVPDDHRRVRHVHVVGLPAGNYSVGAVVGLPVQWLSWADLTGVIGDDGASRHTRPWCAEP